ncbi:MAG: hypothetical protein Kow0099_32830 [Candidatus Abyssubacteria bacterium]
MLFSSILPGKWGGHKESSGGAAVAEGFAHERTIAFEMGLHVPCEISGVTREGSTWSAEVITVSLNSYGAHLMVPADCDLEGEVRLAFNVPGPLRALFEKRRFRVSAEVKPSGAASPAPGSRGGKLMHVAFSAPLHFRYEPTRCATRETL